MVATRKKVVAASLVFMLLPVLAQAAPADLRMRAREQLGAAGKDASQRVALLNEEARIRKELRGNGTPALRKQLKANRAKLQALGKGGK